jgi:hypothetical protein
MVEGANKDKNSCGNNMLPKTKLRIAIRKNINCKSDVDVKTLLDCLGSKTYWKKMSNCINNLKIRYVEIFRGIIKRARWNYGI